MKEKYRKYITNNYSFDKVTMFAILALIIVIILMGIFNYYLIIRKEENRFLDKVSIILIILGYVVFLSLTYDPPRNYIFYDTTENKYGIDIYS